MADDDLEDVCSAIESEFDGTTAMYGEEDYQKHVFVYFPLDNDPDQYIDALTDGRYEGVDLTHAPEYSDEGYVAFSVSA